MSYASKELIERAVQASLYQVYGDFNHDEIFGLVEDLAKATKLPDNWIAPVGDAIMGEHRPDAPVGSSDARAWADHYLNHWPNGCADRDTMAGWFWNAMKAKHDEMLASGAYVEANDPEHEAKIRAWREEAMKLIPEAHHVGHPRLRVLHVGEIDDICDIDRRALRPKPSPVLSKSDEIERLRKDRDEALERADVEAKEHNPTSDDDSVLREWLERYDPEDCMNTTPEQDQAVLAELTRRALARRAK